MTLPAQVSVVVIGGGIMGCSTLHHLAALGADAVLLERGRLTQGTTWHSAAQVRALRHSRNLTEMIRASVDLYARLEAETGQSVGWIRKGSLSIATTPNRLTHVRRQKALADAFGVRAETVTAAEAAERWPAMRADDVLGAVWSPDDGRVGPSDLCAALVKGARAKGGRVFEGTGVTGIRTERGRVAGVETTAGPIRCDAVAICAGLWSRDVAALGGARAPLWPCEHFYLLTKPIEGLSGPLPTLSDHDRHLYVRDDSGGLLVGCFEPMGKAIPPGTLTEAFAFGLLPEDWDHFEPMMENALHRLPALETAEVKMLLNGPESFTPDGMFMLGETAETPGLFLGTGMNSVGVASGGGAGMALAGMIVEGAAPFDLPEADPKRFAPAFDTVEHLMARAPEVLGAHYEIAYPGRQWRSARGLRHTPCHAVHAARGARFAQVHAWERPTHYGADGPLTFGRPAWHDAVAAEVRAAHEAAAVFDVSTFGKIDVEGPEAEAFLQALCTADMARPPGSVMHAAMLNRRGTYEADLTAQRLGPERYRLFTGTATIRRDLAWLRRQAGDRAVTLTDATGAHAVLALSGPQAPHVAATLGGGLPTRFFHHAEARLAGVPVRAARLSYVGEYGWEIACDPRDAPALLEAMLEAGAVPAGLHAQTSMRIEKGFAAMGHELDGDVTPQAAGLAGRAKPGGFLGAEALARPLPRTLATIVLDDPEAVPIGGEPVLLDGRIAGLTTSASFGHRVGRPVALAHVEGARDAAVAVDIAGRAWPGRMTLAPAFDPTGARMRRAPDITREAP